MNIELRDHLEEQLFLHGEVVLHMVVKDFKVLEDLRVETDLFKEVLSNLMVLNHTEHTDLPILQGLLLSS